MFGNKHRANEKEVQKAVEQLNQGSAEAFHILYEKYRNNIYKFCLRMLNEVELAEDAFQETFIKIYEHSSEFKGENFSAWAFKIARNTCLNYLRSKKEFISFNDELYEPIDYQKEDIVLSEFIKKAIAQLPIPLREALILREYEDLSYQEIANILNIDLSLAKIRVHRSRLILRKILEPLKKEIYESR
ncbi:MAG: RNA polymerase sigma factor [Candidatus Kapabacteria bacterium]|nr:RNA polymerase sigma factor [Candidatus Kapabacteria bacterium]